MIDLLIQKEVQDYIFDHENEDVNALILKHRELFEIPVGIIADQIAGRKKIIHKLPGYFHRRGIVYPPSVNLEQTSSEATANFKADILHKLNIQNIADLTSGFGIDSFAFAKKFKRVVAVEPDSHLLEISKHNHHVLGQHNVEYYNTTAEEFLSKTTEMFDCIFIDPSRRDDAKRKVFRFSECKPDVVELLPQMLNRSKFVLIKASPLVDLHLGAEELLKVEKIFIPSVDNECKEVLFLCDNNVAEDPEVRCVDLSKGVDFTFSFNEENKAESTFSDTRRYLYEPSTAILKGGAFKLAGHRFGLSKLHTNTHLYTSDRLVENFPGRIFEVISPVKKNISELLPAGKANIITRNYPLKPEQLKKKLKLEDGGSGYLIAFTGISGKHLILASRLK